MLGFDWDYRKFIVLNLNREVTICFNSKYVKLLFQAVILIFEFGRFSRMLVRFEKRDNKFVFNVKRNYFFLL